MRALLFAALFAVGAASLFGTPAQAQGYSGNYAGTYTASRLPGQELKIGINFRQLNQNVIVAMYATSSGVSGVCNGTINGNVATMTCTNSTSSCPGVYRDRYTFSGTTVTWIYAGRDCLGSERGKGSATKLAF
jgi:hypothetical protein